MLLNLYQSLPYRLRVAADRRAETLENVREIERKGFTRTFAVITTARRHKIAASTIWRWLRMVAGEPRQSWAAALAPAHAPSIRLLLLECFRALPENQRVRVLRALVAAHRDTIERLLAEGER